MCQSRYCRRHHSGISSNITNTTHFVRHPRHLRQHTAHLSHTGAPSLCHVTIARRPGNRPQHVTHTGTLPRLARHKCKHIIHASTPPTQVHHPRQPRQHKQHAISQTNTINEFSIKKCSTKPYLRQLIILTYCVKRKSAFFYSLFYIDI